MDDWEIEFYSDFYEEFLTLSEVVQNELLASLIPLRKLGPTLGRPIVDTLNASTFRNMKELRFNADDGVWRVAFAFDPERTAILLVAGEKSGKGQRQFYKRLIQKADTRYTNHLKQLEGKTDD
jgi:hypothetical protein